ncbi:alpha/beta fold hydrolase [Dongshaea marina]|uniref:alpha/beta fold hydrolase n=1 Tax=Dongshaea marina TaxID=2047966 RepID=UPI00131F0C9B|nr:alpha/beta hydrolase [Dongshaea marina]
MVEEKQFEVQGKSVAAQLWHPKILTTNEAALPIIALHGFLDNSGSFTELAPRLAEYSLLALDLQGHGKSDHRSADASYNVWDDISGIITISQQMNWDRFYLLGHSRGAIVAALLAAIKPQLVAKLVLLDGFMPAPIPEEEAPQQLARATEDSLKPIKPHRICTDLDPFIQVRRSGRYPLSVHAAMHLMARGVRRSPKGYHWAHDPRLNHASQFKLSQPQIEAFIEAITCPSQLLIATKGAVGLAEQTKSLLNYSSNIEIEQLPGSHHFHLEPGSVDAVASAVRSFLLKPC